MERGRNKVLFSALEPQDFLPILEQDMQEKVSLAKITSSTGRWLRFIRSPFWLCLLIGILVRLFLVLHALPALAGDEANTGLQAENILRGLHPIYYYGQPYLGSLEAYILALFFAVAGPSVLVLRIGMMCISLVLVCLTWKFGSALADQVGLKGHAKTTFVVIATLISALPPLYDAVLEMRSWGGYIEAMIIMLWLLYAALRFTQRWHAQASLLELTLRWFGLGFLVGVGLWIDPLVIYAIVTAALWIGWYILVEFVRPSSPMLHPRSTSIKKTLLAIVAVPAALLGFAPGIDFGLKNHWANITYMLHNGSTGEGTNLSSLHQIITSYGRCVAPRVIGGTLPTEPFVTQGHPGVLTPGLIVNGICIGLAGLAILFSLFWYSPTLIRVRQLTVLPFVFMVVTSLIYCSSSIVAREIELAGCGQTDSTGRYAVPLAIVLPFFLAAFVTLFWQTTSLQPATHEALRIEQPHRSSLHLSIRALLLALLAVYFSTQFYAYAVSSPQNTFKNAGCRKAPASDTAIIDYMRQIHLSYAFATGWIGDPITFNTDESIIVTEPPSIARIPANSLKVSHASHYGLLLFDQTSDTTPTILKLLNKYHYEYAVRRFPTIPGWDVMVISTPQQNISLTDPRFSGLLRTQLYDQC
jgi:hypothetical protein